MTIPLWCALAFAAWTLLTLGLTVGHYRWSRTLTGRARFVDYGTCRIEGAGDECDSLCGHGDLHFGRRFSRAAYL